MRSTTARVNHRHRTAEPDQRGDGAGGEEGAQGPAAERVCELAEVAGGEVLADGVDREGDRERDHLFTPPAVKRPRVGRGRPLQAEGALSSVTRGRSSATARG